MKFYTSDNHFNHAKLLEYLPNTRKFKDVTEMNEIMIYRWNQVVSPDDEVYHLGDFAFGDPELIPGIVLRLNGKKHLCYGNHDLGKEEYHEKAAWESIQDGLYITEDNGKRIWLHHYPYGVTWDKRGYVRPKQTEEFDIALSGHVHDKWMVNDHESMNVGVDQHDFYPLTLEQLIERCKDQPRFDSSTKLLV